MNGKYKGRHRRSQSAATFQRIDSRRHRGILQSVKQKPGKPHAKALHQPIPELVKAEEMPKKKRCKSINRRRKETWAEILKSMASVKNR